MQNKLNRKKFFLSCLLSGMFICGTGVCNQIVSAVNDKVNKKVFSRVTELRPSWGHVIEKSPGFFIAGENKTDQKVYFGVNTKTNLPYEWWIAGRTFSNGEISIDEANSSHMILYSSNVMLKGEFGDSDKEKKSVDLSDTQKKEFSKEIVLNPNHYGISVLRKKIINHSNAMMSSDERRLVRDSSVKIFDHKNNEIYMNVDKFYLPSGNEKLGLVSWSCEDISVLEDLNEEEKKKIIPQNYLAKNEAKEGNICWLRSASSKNKICQQASFSDESLVKDVQIFYGFNVAMLCKINLEKISFAASASAFYPVDVRDGFGKVMPVNKEHYGMHLKTIPADTALSDAVLVVDKQCPTKLIYENVLPKETYLSACMTECDNIESSYIVSLKLNEKSGVIDLASLDMGVVGANKRINVVMWLEMKDSKGVVVATNPKEITMITPKSLIIQGDVLQVKLSEKESLASKMMVTFEEKTLRFKEDYKVDFADDDKVGEGVVIVTGLNQYAGKSAVGVVDFVNISVKITIKDKEVSFSGEVVNVDEAILEGIDDLEKVKGNVIYFFFKDKECSKKICSFCSSKGETPKNMPKQPGEYYVKAFLKETKNYAASESNVAKITIKAE